MSMSELYLVALFIVNLYLQTLWVFNQINFLINFYCKYFIGLLDLIYDIYRLFNCIFP